MSNSENKLKHEFVGMMFAITIGEIGLQTAALVQAGSLTHFLPAYSHLFVATVLVAASWVGWSRSPSPGAKADVKAVFQLEFLVLLVDVFLVICYFIVVRTVDFSNENRRIDPSSKLAFWLLVIFSVYLAWDLITKVAIYFWDLFRNRETYRRNKGRSWFRESFGSWLKEHGLRMVPTLVCLALAAILWKQVKSARASQMIAADLALLCLVLLFRALKDLVTAWFRSESPRLALFWNAVCILGILVGIAGVKGYWSLPNKIADQIQMPSADVTPHRWL